MDDLAGANYRKQRNSDSERESCTITGPNMRCSESGVHATGGMQVDVGGREPHPWIALIPLINGIILIS